MKKFVELTVESASLTWLETLGWSIANGPDIAPDMLAAERSDYSEVVLAQKLRDAMLHKLISDEMHLNNTEKFIGRVL